MYNVFLILFVFIFVYFVIELYANSYVVLRDLCLQFIVINSFLLLLFPFLFDYFDIKLYNYDIDIEAFICILLYFLFLFIGRIGLQKDLASNQFLDKRKLFSEFDDRYLGKIIFVYVIIVGLFSYKFIPMLMSNPAAYLSNRIQLLSGNGYLASMSSLGFPIFFILYYKVKYKKNRRKNIVKLIFIFFTILIVAAVKGSRVAVIEPFIIIALSEILFGISRIKPTLIIKSFLAIICLVSLISLLGNIRQSDDLEKGSVDIERNVKEIQNNFNHFEYFQVFQDKSDSFLYGKSLIAILTLPVPRAFWAEKPVGGGPYLKNVVHPGSYDLVHNENNTSLTTGLFLESYMNFGVYGVVFLSVFFGIMLKRLSKKLFLKRTRISISLMLFFTAYILVFVITTGELLGTFSRVVYYIIPFIFYPKRNDQYIY